MSTSTPLSARSPSAPPSARGRRRGALAVGGALAVLALAGCAATGAASNGAASGAPEAVADGVVAQDRAALAPGEAVAGSGTGSKAIPVLPGSVTGPSVIVMASLVVRTPDVPAATAAARAAVTAAGGTVASLVSTSGEPGSCDPQPMTADGAASDAVATCPPGLAAGTVMTLRVPPARLDSLTADLSRLGDVVSASTSSTDVAAEVADVDARVATARASLARVRVLMGRATTLADVVALEGELSRRQGDLEALEARQRVLADETAQATLTVTLTAAPVPVAATEDSGFLAGLRSGWAAFVTASGVLLTALGASLPFLLLGVVVVALVWWVRRRVARRDAERAAAAAAAATAGEVRDDEPVGAGA